MTKKIYIAVVLILIVSLCVAYFFFSSTSYTKKAQENQSDVSSFSTLTEKSNGVVYANSKYRFTAQLSQGFTFREFELDGSDMIIFEGPQGEGIQIVISPFDDVKILTSDMISSDVPDMKILEAEPVEIGSGNRGVAFKSDNEAFDGASREVWFVWKSHLYQISTYERFDSVLKLIFSTWEFRI